MNWKSSDIESLDYDLFESVVNKSGMGYRYRNGTEKNKLVYARWCVTLLTGVVTALVAVLLLYCTNECIKWKKIMLEYYIQHETKGHILFGSAFIWLLLFNLFFIFIAVSLTSCLAPVAGGSGISEVKTTLNGMKIPGLLRLRTLLVKVIGTFCTVVGGLPVGKEGPMIHSGSIVAAGLSQGKSVTLGYDTSFSYFAGFRNDKEKRDFVSCGAAAGVAAAFGAPIGGVLFVLEEGASFWNQSLTWRTLFCAMSATFTLAFFMSGMSDPNVTWGTLGSHSGTFSFGPFSSSTYQLWEVPLFILIGIFGGIQGALFNSLNTKFTFLRSRWVRLRRVAWIEALVISLLISTVTFTAPHLFGTCHDLPKEFIITTVLSQKPNAISESIPASVYTDLSDASMMQYVKDHSSQKALNSCICKNCSNMGIASIPCTEDFFKVDKEASKYPYKKDLLRFYCPEGQYNDLATLLLSSGEAAIKHLFHAPPESFDVKNLILFWFAMLFLACLTYGLKVPSGLFVPCLLVGAAYGRLWTRVINYFTLMAGSKLVDPRTYGLVGSAAMLGGVTRMTISLTVIILECTGNIEYGLPLILTSFFARWIGNAFNEGIYDIHIHSKHVPFLDWNPPVRGTFLRVKHIMTANPKVLRSVESAGVIFDLLTATKHNAFPVVIEDSTFGKRFFAGVILRKQLNVLLKERDFSVEKPKPFHRIPATSFQAFEAATAHTENSTSDINDAELNALSERLLSKQSSKDVFPPSTTDYCLSYHDMESHYPHYPIPLANGGGYHPDPMESGPIYTLADEDRNCWVDLTPYMNQTPYVIQEEAPFTRAYRLFRSAGLRHLIVVNRHNNVRGIITRRELEDDHCTRCFQLAKRGMTDTIYPLSYTPSINFIQKLRRTVSRTDQVKRALSNRNVLPQ